MSSEVQPAVALHGVTKQYQLYKRPVDRLLRRLGWSPGDVEVCDALKGVDLEVAPGETFGIVGKNGSGKSTLLQIVCGTLSPTSGSIQVDGRVAALLELGAGFNPAFTGRENVYLNARILGLTRAEIDARLPEIIAFSGIERFLDNPVRTYSSGMFVRLAFSVAIHVDPAVLVVDEALSVGDLDFQNKCKRRLRQLQDAGTTILFVSHDLGMVQVVCDRAMWLHEGEVQAIGDSVEICQDFYAHSSKREGDAPAIMQQATEEARFERLELDRQGEGGEPPTYREGEPIQVRFRLSTRGDIGEVAMAVSIFDGSNDLIIGQTSREGDVLWETGPDGLEGVVTFGPGILGPGDYHVVVGAFSADLEHCYALTEAGLRFAVRFSYPLWGKVLAPCVWERQVPA